MLTLSSSEETLREAGGRTRVWEVRKTRLEAKAEVEEEAQRKSESRATPMRVDETRSRSFQKETEAEEEGGVCFPAI